jgi:hypothetical protein
MEIYEQFGRIEVDPIEDSRVIYYLNRNQIILLLTSVSGQYQIKADIITELNRKLPDVVVGSEKDLQLAEAVKEAYKEIFKDEVQNPWTSPVFSPPILSPPPYEPPHRVGDPLPGENPFKVTCEGITTGEENVKKYKWVPEGTILPKEDQLPSESDKVPSSFKDKAQRIITQ